MATFMRGFEDGEGWVHDMQHVKRQLKQSTHTAISEWFAQGKSSAPMDNKHLFSYIIGYMINGRDEIMLGHAMAEIGYTREALDVMRAQGQTALDVAREVLGRGVKPAAAPAH